MAACAAATVLGLYHLGAKSMWFDETVSVWLSRRSVAAYLAGMAHHDPNSALYVVLLHFWRVVGTGDAWIRSLSVVFYVASVLVIWRLGVRLFSPLVGSVAALLVASNTLAVTWAQQARCYSLLLLLSAASTWALVHAIDRRSPAAWFGYGVLLTCAAYTHMFGWLLLPAHALAVGGHPERGRVARPLAVTYAGVAVATAPLLVFAVIHGANQVAWVPPVTPRRLLDALASLASGHWMLLLSAALGAFGVVTGWRRPHATERWALLLTGAWVTVPVLSTLIVSVHHPLLVDRYLIGTIPALCLLVGAGMARVQQPVLTVVLATLMAFLVVLRLNAYYRSPPSEDWRAVARYVTAAAAPADVVFPDGEAVAYERYAGTAMLWQRSPAVCSLWYLHGPVIGAFHDPHDSWRPPGAGWHRVSVRRFPGAVGPITVTHFERSCAAARPAGAPADHRPSAPATAGGADLQPRPHRA